jgi:ketosteroid isomerase-like protein
VGAPAETEAVLVRAYQLFNNRNIDGALALMHPDVEWPNGMEGGYVRGREAVREYWRRQWRLIDPSVTPLSFHAEDDGRTRVEVHQVVRDLSGALISEQLVQHLYRLDNGLILHMEIRAP